MKFTFPVSVEESELYITLTQNGKKIIEYTEKSSGVSRKDNTVTLKMVPSETSLFSAANTDAFALVQINLIFGGERHATRPIRIPIHANLKAEAAV